MKQIEALGQRVAELMLGGTPVVDGINRELTQMAMRVSGVRADELSNEDMENSPIVRLYWRTLAELTAAVLHKAAEKQTYYRELDR